MKRKFKIAGVSLLIFIGLLLIGATIVMWLVFSPEKLTPIVKKQLPKYINCDVDLQQVNFSFFHSFPNATLKIDDLLLVNPVSGAPSDTLLCVDNCFIDMDLWAFIKNKAVIVNQFHLKNGKASLFIDSSGRSNYDVVVSDTTTVKDESSLALERIDLHGIIIENLNLDYLDIPGKMQVSLKGIDLNVDAGIDGKLMTGDVKLTAGNLLYHNYDSLSSNIVCEKLDAVFKGTVNDFNEIKGRFNASANNFSVFLNDVSYLDSANVSTSLSADAILDKLNFIFTDAVVELDDHRLEFSGNLSKGWDMQLKFAGDQWNLAKTLELVPAPFKSTIPVRKTSGMFSFSGTANGTYNDSVMPVIAVDLKCNDVGFFAPEYWSQAVRRLNANLHADVDLNAKSKLTIKDFSAETGNNSFKGSGTVDDVTGNMYCNLAFDVNLLLQEFQSFLPDGVKSSGRIKGRGNASFPVAQLIDKMKLSGSFHLADFDLAYDKMFRVVGTDNNVAIKIPGSSGKNLFTEFLSAELESADLYFEYEDMLKFDSQDVICSIGLSNVLDTTVKPSVVFDIASADYNFSMDSITATILRPTTSFSMIPVGEKLAFTYAASGDNLRLKTGELLSFKADNVVLENGTALYGFDETKNVLSQFIPEFSTYIKNGSLSIKDLADTLYIPVADVSFHPNHIDFRNTRYLLGNSDFELSGEVTNISEYIDNKDLLTARLDFTSNNADVYQLMDYVNGFGNDTLQVDASDNEGDPFMVPLGVDFRMNTKVKKASVGKTDIQDVGGHLTIKDGVMTLEEVGFTTKAARMQLTALYRSVRKNHLFAGIDLHLLDINIAELIDIIPQVDTIVPMLKSFDGKAGFHFAIETYMTSNYDLKISTLRGAAAIEGQNLTLERSNTFNKIAEKLLYNRDGKIIVDSLSVEMTVFRDEIDLYPFLLAFNNYEAVIGGRHNLDETFDYHISITNSPLPVRLGLDIKGSIDNLKYNVVPCKYAHMYRPNKQSVVDKQTLELKKLISESLKANVK